jgi:hypothetical protein
MISKAFKLKDVIKLVVWVIETIYTGITDQQIFFYISSKIMNKTLEIVFKKQNVFRNVTYQYCCDNDCPQRNGKRGSHIVCQQSAISTIKHTRSSNQMKPFIRLSKKS